MKENRLNQQLEGYSALILDLESSNDKKDILLNKANREKENLRNILTITETELNNTKKSFKEEKHHLHETI